MCIIKILLQRLAYTSLVKELAKLFKARQETLEDDYRLSRHAEVVTAENIDHVKIESLSDRRLKTNSFSLKEHLHTIRLVQNGFNDFFLLHKKA